MDDSLKPDAARARKVPYVAPARLASQLDVFPAHPVTGGEWRVAHCLARAAGNALPAGVRRKALREVVTPEGAVAWRPIERGLTVRSDLLIEHGPADVALGRLFEFAQAQGWLPPDAWVRVRVGARVRRVLFERAGERAAEYVLEGASADRAELVASGLLRYVREAAGTGFGPWGWVPGHAQAHEALDVHDLDHVWRADTPDAPGARAAPVRFVADVARWSSLPVDARAALRLVTCWHKAPGILQTAPLDTETAAQVREVAARWTDAREVLEECT